MKPALVGIRELEVELAKDCHTSLEFHFPKMLTALATSIPMTVREISASIIMSVFAALVNGYVSVGLSAVAAVKATNR